MSGNLDWLLSNPPPVWREIERAWDWARTVSPWWDELELFLNPADHDGLNRPREILGAPVHASIGVPEGSALVFDRRRMCYTRCGEQP